MDTREELASHFFTRYSKYGNKFPKAIEAVLSGSVKKHTFSPSGRAVLTVVGRDGEEFIDPERPFCSCNNFFLDRKSTRLNSSHRCISYAVFCLKKKNT